MSNKVDEYVLKREQDIRLARELRAKGESLFAIATKLGRSKDWLREVAGVA